MKNRFIKRKVVIKVPVYLRTPKGIMNATCYKILEYKMKIKKRLRNEKHRSIK